MTNKACSAVSTVTPPYLPEVSSASDTSNFDVEENDYTPSTAMPPTTHSAFTGHHLPFVGFTYTKNRYSMTSQNTYSEQRGNT